MKQSIPKLLKGVMWATQLALVVVSVGQAQPALTPINGYFKISIVPREEQWDQAWDSVYTLPDRELAFGGITNDPRVALTTQRLLDSLYFRWDLMPTTAILSFRYDSSQSLLRNVHYEDHYVHVNYLDPNTQSTETFETRHAIDVSSIPFEIENDTVIASLRGSVLKLAMTNTSYLDEHSFYSRSKYVHSSGNRLTMDRLNAEDSGFETKITFLLGAKATVAAPTYRPGSGLTAHFTIPNANIQFKFAESATRRDIELFDPIGRLQRRLSVCANENTLTCRSDLLPPGLYFARLGEMTTSFVVP